MEVWILVIGVPVFVFIAWLAQPQCPGCGSRGTVSHRHQRKDGGADLRYKNNPASCSSCGWSG